MGQILVIDDEPLLAAAVARVLRGGGHAVATAGRGEEGLDRAGAAELDVVLLDLGLPDLPGLEVLRRLRDLRPDVETIVITGQATVRAAVEAIQLGAFDFLEKPFENERLSRTVDKALERRRLVRRTRELEAALEGRERLEGLVAASAPMVHIVQQVRQVASTEVPVLLLGESGVGKEMIARALHRHSRRNHGPFVAVNCVAIPEGLQESEFFGHVRGAFTGADRDQPGLFQTAHGGTLFLDEVGEIPLSLQAKLLRALEEGRIRPVGSPQSVPVGVRLVSATNRDVDAALATGKVRKDFYYRLGVVRIEVPPLRDRREDIAPLVRHFVAQKNSRFDRHVDEIEPEALALLESYDWPGNVRELENVVERAFALGGGGRLLARELPAVVRSQGGRPSSSPSLRAGGIQTLKEVEADALRRALASAGGNVLLAARMLALSKSSLYRKLAQHRIALGRRRADKGALARPRPKARTPS